MTIPQETRRQAGIEPGDVLQFEATGQGYLVVRTLPRHRKMADVLERYGVRDAKLDPKVWDALDEEMGRQIAARFVGSEKDR